jgi:hypothetical protein
MNTINKAKFDLVNKYYVEYSELDYSDKKTLQAFEIRGVEAVNKLVAEFNGDLVNEELTALVLGSLTDLQVRDYCMGITTAENLNKLNNLWSILTAVAPAGAIAPVATLWAITHYEMGNTALALEALDIASSDNSEYSLTKLIARVISAGWPTESFQAMRNELHTKILAGIYETN